MHKERLQLIDERILEAREDLLAVRDAVKLFTNRRTHDAIRFLVANETANVTMVAEDQGCYHNSASDALKRLKRFGIVSPYIQGRETWYKADLKRIDWLLNTIREFKEFLQVEDRSR